MKYRNFIFLLISIFVLSINIGLAQKPAAVNTHQPDKTSSQKAIDGFTSLFGSQFLSAVLPQEKRISATGDFMVHIVDLIDPRTGQIIGSRTEREIVINGVRYKAAVFGRREQMTTKFNIPIQGVLAGDTIILDDNPARIVNAGEFSALGVDQSKISSDVVVADVGGRVVYFPNKFEFDKFVYQEIMWESKIGPVRPGEARSDVEASPYTEGAKTVLFMRVDFSDKPGDPLPSNNLLTASNAQSLMDNEVSPFYVNNSYGKTSLQTTVTPLLRMPKPLSDYVQAYNQSSGAGLNLLLTDARAGALAPGLTPATSVSTLSAASYNSGLDFAGVAWAGDKGQWLNGYFDLRVTTHELGHNYGLDHANLYRTSDGNPIGAGTDIEYGDCYDSMGNGGCSEGQNPRIHFNANYKRNLDWLTDANVQTVTTNGTYRITAHDSATAGGIRALKIAKNASRNYWIEFRQLFTGNAANGALIRWDHNSQRHRAFRYDSQQHYGW